MGIDTNEIGQVAAGALGRWFLITRFGLDLTLDLYRLCHRGQHAFFNAGCEGLVGLAGLLFADLLEDFLQLVGVVVWVLLEVSQVELGFLQLLGYSGAVGIALLLVSAGMANVALGFFESFFGSGRHIFFHQQRR